MKEHLTNKQDEATAKHKMDSLGYQFGDHHMAIRDAIQMGFALVDEVKKSGKFTRSWAEQISAETKIIIEDLKKTSGKGPVKNIAGEEAERQLWEIAYWENEISRMIRLYFSDISGAMDQLKRLNPPLNTAQIDPFLKSILEERRQTIVLLEPLTRVVDELTSLKSKLAIESSKIFRTQAF